MADAVHRDDDCPSGPSAAALRKRRQREKDQRKRERQARLEAERRREWNLPARVTLADFLIDQGYLADTYTWTDADADAAALRFLDDCADEKVNVTRDRVAPKPAVSSGRITSRR